MKLTLESGEKIDVKPTDVYYTLPIRGGTTLHFFNRNPVWVREPDAQEKISDEFWGIDRPRLDR
jgi:hypothetical protein